MPAAYARRDNTILAIRELALRLGTLCGRNVPGPMAGELLTASFLMEAQRAVFDFYCLEQMPGTATRALDWLRVNRDSALVEDALLTFVSHFPPCPTVSGAATPEEYLSGATGGAANAEIVLREITIFELARRNPAMEPLCLLFEDDALRDDSGISSVAAALDDYFGAQPPVDILGKGLVTTLREPSEIAPDSLDAQLRHIRAYWSGLLAPDLLEQLFLVEGVVREETAARLPGPGPAEVMQFHGDNVYKEPQPERFSADAGWMPYVVMIAKSAHVWLDQLSKRHNRWIRRLDEIPDEELDRLANWGFTAVWLIGVWERSNASARIKRRMGNQDAAASAYAIHDYTIADALGGEAALSDLRARAEKRGIRLACDMVPNHMGIYSKWVVEHPDWFIQVEEPPFPKYQFTGEDLSDDPRISLHIEDGYWDKSDAAVVFRHTDNETGVVRYIYHGNDGTTTPWNDTAQLNYLMPEVREAVLDNVLRVARLFPVIRFDAAMTLTNRHFHRLWYPEADEAGAIPSRAEHGMTRTEFQQRMPEEFWRTVVDRAAEEAPNALLLAEAFWLMEGYFVRTLGMHRVYNSSFMHMLREENNADYRSSLKNVLEYSPEILKRFVNYLSNPDEDTAANQFGRGDKYLGACVMLATMPGLPMFGHGQVEGFTEKYGMEYVKAYSQERADEALIQRHEREVFPLLRRRPLFEGAEEFALYDVTTHADGVDENVFAYSNRHDGEAAFVCFNNSNRETKGVVHTSAAYNVGTDRAPEFVRRPLTEALGLTPGADRFCIFRDHAAGMEYIRPCQELAEKGLALSLAPYGYRVLLDFREVTDADGTWAELARQLDGKGTPSIDEAHRALVLSPLVSALKEGINGRVITGLLELGSGSVTPCLGKLKHVETALERFSEELHNHAGSTLPVREPIERMTHWLEQLARFEHCLGELELEPDLGDYVLAPLRAGRGSPLFWRIPVAWCLLYPLDEALGGGRAKTDARNDGGRPSLADEWLLSSGVSDAFMEMGREEWLAKLDAQLMRLVLRHLHVLAVAKPGDLPGLLRDLLNDSLVRDFLFVNQFDGVLWLNKEQLEELTYWIAFLGSLLTLGNPSLSGAEQEKRVFILLTGACRLLRAADQARYEVPEVLKALS